MTVKRQVRSMSECFVLLCLVWHLLQLVPWHLLQLVPWCILQVMWRRMAKCSLAHIRKHTYTDSQSCPESFSDSGESSSSSPPPPLQQADSDRKTLSRKWVRVAELPVWISLWWRRRWAASLPSVTKCLRTALTVCVDVYIFVPESFSFIVTVKPPDDHDLHLPEYTIPKTIPQTQ